MISNVYLSCFLRNSEWTTTCWDVMGFEIFFNKTKTFVTPCLFMNLNWLSWCQIIHFWIKSKRFSRTSWALVSKILLIKPIPSLISFNAERSSRFKRIIQFVFPWSQYYNICSQIVFRNIIILVKNVIIFVFIVRSIRFRILNSNNRMSSTTNLTFIKSLLANIEEWICEFRLSYL